MAGGRIGIRVPRGQPLARELARLVLRRLAGLAADGIEVTPALARRIIEEHGEAVMAAWHLSGPRRHQLKAMLEPETLPGDGP